MRGVPTSAGSLYHTCTAGEGRITKTHAVAKQVDENLLPITGDLMLFPLSPLNIHIIRAHIHLVNMTSWQTISHRSAAFWKKDFSHLFLFSTVIQAFPGVFILRAWEKERERAVDVTDRVTDRQKERGRKKKYRREEGEKIGERQSHALFTALQLCQSNFSPPA